MQSITKRLPDAEFKIMKCIWHMDCTITSSKVMEHLGDGGGWKPQTVLTLLTRLCDKGFLSSEKSGKERVYSPLVSEAEYLSVETDDFMHRYAGLPLRGLVKTLFQSGGLTAGDIDDLKQLLEEQEERLDE